MSKQIMKILKAKQGMSLNQVPATVMTIGIAAMFGAVILIVLSEMGTQTTDPNATEAITNSKNGLVKIFAWFTTIGLVIGGVIVISYLVKAFK